MKITKITLNSGKIRLVNGPAKLAKYTIQLEKLDVFSVEEMEAVQLISYGLVPAKPAADLKIGDVIGYNYGYGAEVLAIEEASPAYLTFTLKEVGKIRDRTKGPETYKQRKLKTGLIPLMQDF